MKEAKQEETTAGDQPIEPIIRETPEALKEDEELETMTGDPEASPITPGAEASGIFGPTHGGKAQAGAGYYGPISKSEVAVSGVDGTRIIYDWNVLAIDPKNVMVKVQAFNNKGKPVWVETKEAGVTGRMIVHWGHTIAVPKLRAMSSKLHPQTVKWWHKC